MKSLTKFKYLGKMEKFYSKNDSRKSPFPLKVNHSLKKISLSQRPEEKYQWIFFDLQASHSIARQETLARQKISNSGNGFVFGYENS